MNPQGTSDTSMDEDHRLWDHEHLGWLADLELWQSDYRNALDALQRLQKQVSEYGDDLNEHLHSVLMHQQRLRDHRREMAEYHHRIDGLSDEFQQSLARGHVQQAKDHERATGVHEVLRAKHSQLIEQLSKLAGD